MCSQQVALPFDCPVIERMPGTIGFQQDTHPAKVAQTGCGDGSDTKALLVLCVDKILGGQAGKALADDIHSHAVTLFEHLDLQLAAGGEMPHQDIRFDRLV